MSKAHNKVGKAQKKRQPHRFTSKVCHWQYCTRCGLVALKNEPTEIAIRAGCDEEEK